MNDTKQELIDALVVLATTALETASDLKDERLYHNTIPTDFNRISDNYDGVMALIYKFTLEKGGEQQCATNTQKR